MPVPFLKKLSHESHVPTKKLEKVWHKVEKSAEKSGAKEPYAVATKIVEEYAKKHGK